MIVPTVYIITDLFDKTLSGDVYENGTCAVPLRGREYKMESFSADDTFTMKLQLNVFAMDSLKILNIFAT